MSGDDIPSCVFADIHPAKLFKSMSLCSIDIDDVTEAGMTTQTC